MEKSVAVVIPSFNGARHLEVCIPALLKQTYKNFTIIVVDNGSTDHSAELLENWASSYQNFVGLRNAENQGYTGGMNPGLRYALMHNFDYVAALNNDAVADKNWLQELVQVLDEKQDVAIVTSLILHADGKTVDSTGDWFSVWGLPFPRTRDQSFKEAPEAGFVFGASGGASLYRVPLLKEVGLFDDHYFAYYEDVDLSFRARLAGKQVYYNPAAIVYHAQGETSKALSKKTPGFTIKQAFRNYPHLVLRNVPGNLMWKILPRFLLAYFLFFGNAIRRGNGKVAWRGFLEGIPLSWRAIMHERREVLKLQVIDNKTLYASFWPDLPPDQTGLRKFRDIFIKKRKK